MRILLIPFILSCFLINISCGNHQNSSQSPSLKDLDLKKVTTQAENCTVIPESEKINTLSGKGNNYAFYTMSEDITRFPHPTSDHSVYVIGDIHGTWEMIFHNLVNSGVMELDQPSKKQVVIQFKKQSLTVEIPNLKFRGNSHNKVILMGDYISKSNPIREQRTLGLLADVLNRQKAEKRNSIIAILGNHDLEAVNGVVHPGYMHEKNYEDQIFNLVREELVVPTYYYNGIWYSHSYLTPDDIHEFRKEMNGNFIPHGSTFSGILKGSQDVNHFIRNKILTNTIKDSWLASSEEGRKYGDKGPFNFFYTMGSPVAKDCAVFPIIMGHLSDKGRQVLRVMTERHGGKQHKRFAQREHILNVDTSIYYSFENKTDAIFLKIDYLTNSSTEVRFHSCSVPSGNLIIN